MPLFFPPVKASELFQRQKCHKADPVLHKRWCCLYTRWSVSIFSGEGRHLPLSPSMSPCPAPWGTGHQKEFPQTPHPANQLTSCQSSGSLGPARERKEAGGEFPWRRLEPITPGFTSQTDRLPTSWLLMGRLLTFPVLWFQGLKTRL